MKNILNISYLQDSHSPHPTMSADDPKEFSAVATSRWRSFLAALLVSIFIVCIIDASTILPHQPSILLGDYFGPISAAPSPLSWISPPLQPNFTSTLLARWLAPADASRTETISVPALDGIPVLHLSLSEIHEFSVRTLDADGHPRTSGGDYFETDLSGGSWKSRPPVTDHGNGTYTFKLQVHPDFPGDYTLTITLLFRSFEGLKVSPERFKFRRELRRFLIHFVPGNLTLPNIPTCKNSDYGRDAWSGRWTRHGAVDSCAVDSAGRYRCLAADHRCEAPWCAGALGALESSGWVYSAHCSFLIFNHESAWRCLSNRWLFFWGDSNHVDTIRNLLNFVLGLTDVKSVPRRFDSVFVNPRNTSESVRITSVFNGHWNETENYLGLRSLEHPQFKELLWKYFGEEGGVPDTMVFNSGLHDGVHWKSVRGFANAAAYAAEFWGEVMGYVRERGMRVPRLFYRTTIATGGYARDLAFNPSKMEAFNGVLVEKLKERGLLSSGGVIDEFDMTFPWHYDNRCNDGVHYGRAPAKARWRDGEVGHQYFVDLMLVHVLLNAICDG